MVRLTRDSKPPDRDLGQPVVGIKSQVTAECKTARPLSPFPPPSPPKLLLVDVSVMDFDGFSANLTKITDSLAERPSIVTLATILLSFTGLQDWLKLFLIGGVFETCRRLAFQAWHDVVDWCWITVDFEEGDDSYGER